MDLALNNLQRLIYRKTQTTNQPTNLIAKLIFYVCLIFCTQLAGAAEYTDLSWIWH